jgi:hypothetical protein
MKLLAEYIKLILERTQKSINYIDFHNAPDKEEYLQKNTVTHAGRGSSRSVYILSSKKVVKYGYNQAGIEQNKAEWDIFSKAPHKEIFPKIYRVDGNFKWIEAELVRPLTSEEEFKMLTGVNFNIYKAILYKEFGNESQIKKFIELQIDKLEKMMDDPRLRPPGDGSSTQLTDQIESLQNLLDDSGNLMKLAATAPKLELAVGDLMKLAHYGKAADGRIVMLDYGFTHAVADVWYDSAGRAVSQPRIGSNAPADKTLRTPPPTF